MFTTRSGGLSNIEYMVETRLAEFRCFVKTLHAAERMILEEYLDLDDTNAVVALADSKGLRDALWYSDYLLLALQSRLHTKRRDTDKSGPSTDVKQDNQSTVEMLEQVRHITDLFLRLGTTPDSQFRPSAAEWGSHMGGNAPGGTQDVRALQRRLQLIEQAVGLEVPQLDTIISHLYSNYIQSSLPNASVPSEVQVALTTYSEATRCKVLGALGIAPEFEWKPESATPLCTEVWRTLCEARLKLRLRLWFSCREQTVWRTLTGLMKAGPALKLMQSIGVSKLRQAKAHVELTRMTDVEKPSQPKQRWSHAFQLSLERPWDRVSRAIARSCSSVKSHADGGGAAAAKPQDSTIPEGLYTVMAALQNYAGWRKKQCQLLQAVSSLVESWENTPESAVLAGQIHDQLFGSEKVMSGAPCVSAHERVVMWMVALGLV